MAAKTALRAAKRSEEGAQSHVVEVSHDDSLQLPNADQLQALDGLSSDGLAAKVVMEVLEEARYRRGYATSRLKMQYGLSSRGQWLAFTLGMTTLVGAVLLAVVTRNAWLAGALVSSGAVVSVVASVLGRRPPPDRTV